MKKIFSFFCLLMLAACSYPTESTSTKNDEPTLLFKGASKEAVIYLNGLDVGMAADFNGDPKTLMVPRGTHMLEVKDVNGVIYSQKIFVSDGSVKTINLTGVK